MCVRSSAASRGTVVVCCQCRACGCGWLPWMWGVVGATMTLSHTTCTVYAKCNSVIEWVKVVRTCVHTVKCLSQQLSLR